MKRALFAGVFAFSAIGISNAAWADVPFFNLRFWFYLLLLLDIAVAAYVLYFARTQYPRLIAAAPVRNRPVATNRPVTQQRAMAASRANTASTTPSSPPGVPAPPPARTGTGSRREARRERKRRSR